MDYRKRRLVAIFAFVTFFSTSHFVFAQDPIPDEDGDSYRSEAETEEDDIVPPDNGDAQKAPQPPSRIRRPHILRQRSGGNGPRDPQGESARGVRDRVRDLRSAGGESPREIVGRVRRFDGEDRAKNIGKAYSDVITDPYQAASIALAGIREQLIKTNKETELVPQLEELLKTTNDHKMRNVLLFTIRQIYQDTDDDQKLLDTNKRILRENLEIGKK